MKRLITASHAIELRLGDVLLLETDRPITEQVAEDVKRCVNDLLGIQAVVLEGIRLAGVTHDAGSPIFDALAMKYGWPVAA